jgi:hypothetical protein
MRHLKDGFEPVLKALSNKDLRGNKNFHALLKRDLSQKVFAVLCLRLSQGNAEELLQGYARKENKHLEADTLGIDVNRWSAESLVPQLVYVRLGIKILSGETLYDVEKSTALVQIASDLVAFGLPQTGLETRTVENIQKGFDFAKDVGQGAVQELLRAEQLKALAKKPQALNSEDLAVSKAEEVRTLLRHLESTLQGQQESPVLDVTTTRMLFERVVCVCENSQDLRKVDLRQARLHRLRDGRMFAIPTAGLVELDVPSVQRFFRERFTRLALHGAGRKQDLEADQAYREIVSAWWLLGASNKLPSTH